MRGVIAHNIWEKSCYRQLMFDIDTAMDVEDTRDIEQFNYRCPARFLHNQEVMARKKKRYRNNN